LLELAISKDGLNLLASETIDNFGMVFSLKNYFKLYSRLYCGTALKVRYNNNNTPVYYFNRALGFHDFVRGYEYYVVDGQSYFIGKANINFQLIKPRIAQLPIKRLEKFNRIPYSVYLSSHFDVAYVEDNYYYYDNPLTNSLLLGGGIGINFVTYYDYVFRVEASMNRMKQKGIYLHLTAPL
jgi:hypothetical protein